MGLFGKSKREKELEAQNKALKALLAAEAANKQQTKKSPNAGKTKYVTKCCKYCGYRVTYLANGITPGTTCPKRGKGQPHVWQTLGYQYK